MADFNRINSDIQKTQCAYEIGRFVILLSILISSFLNLASAQSIGPAQPERFEIANHMGSKIDIDYLHFKDTDGSRIDLKTFFLDKPVVVSLVFYKCPDICGLVLNGMLDGFKDINFVPGQDFNVVTISIDPKETSELARLKRDAVIGDLKKVKSSSEWYFLTGEESNIRKLSDQLGFEYKLNAETGLYAHAPGIFVLDSKGNLLVSLADVMYPKEILEYSLIKASNGSLGSWSQKLNAFWREYDFENNSLKLDLFKFGLFILGCLLALLVIYKVVLQTRVNK